MSELVVCVVHITTDTFDSALKIRRWLEEARDEGKPWCGFELMKGVNVKEIGKGVFAQTFNYNGSAEELETHGDIVRGAVFKGLVMSQVLKLTAQEREKREAVFFQRQTVAA
jgi:hypothetical protein